MEESCNATPAAAPRRPMRLTGREVKSASQLHAIVEACHTVRVALVDEEGPFIVPMSFGYDWADPQDGVGEPRLALWVHSATAGRKADAFAGSPRVAIEMDVQDGVITGTFACAYSYAYRSIMGVGTVHKIQSADMKRYGLARIMEHLAPEAEPGFTDQALARCDIYCIDVESFTGKQRA